jgi:hypothetical protein
VLLEIVNGWCTFEFEEKVITPGAPAAIVQNAVEFARERLGFEPDERQAEVLLSDA